MKKNLLLIPLVALLAGCTLFGANPAHPSKFEEGLFNVTTNVVQRVVTVTNSFTTYSVILQTNIVGLVVTQTNVVVVPEVVQITNYSEAYTLTPKPVVQDTANAAGTISNLVLPGSGGLVAGIIAGLATMWAKLRSSKQTGTTLAQNIETMREFIKTLPNGSQNDAAITQFLQKYQAESGVLNQVLSILKNEVSNKNALASVTEIQNALNSITQPPTAGAVPAKA